MRFATGNSGNVEENKSLYWNPVIYKVVNPSSSSKTYQMVDVWFASAYYIWRTGQAKTFPAGLKMRASGSNTLARVRKVCDAPFACEREDSGGCNGIGSNQFFPETGCGGNKCKLEITFITSRQKKM